MKKTPAHNFFDCSCRSLDGPRFKVAHIAKRVQERLDFSVKEAIKQLRLLKKIMDAFFSLQTLTTLCVFIDHFVDPSTVDTAPYRPAPY